MPNQFDYRIDYDDPIITVDLFQKLRCKKTKPAFISLTQLHDDGVHISREKYLDLLRLCTSSIIPTVHHSFYLLLPHE